MQIKKSKLIKPTLYQDSICAIFGKEMALNQRKYYTERGERDLTKLANWSYIGKMAEYAVFNTLISLKKYKSIAPPDIAIYPQEYKSHAADIVADGRQIHVKCHVENYADPSWLFSTKDKVCDNPTDMDIIALVIVSASGDFDCYFVPAKELVEKYKAPLSEKTVARALYEKDII